MEKRRGGNEGEREGEGVGGRVKALFLAVVMLWTVQDEYKNLETLRGGLTKIEDTRVAFPSLTQSEIRRAWLSCPVKTRTYFNVMPV